MLVRFRLSLLLGLVALLALAACGPAAAPPAGTRPAAAPTQAVLAVMPANGAAARPPNRAQATGTASPAPTGTTAPAATITSTATTMTATATMAPTVAPTMAAPTAGVPAASVTPGPNMGGWLFYVANRQIVAKQPGAAAVTTLVADPSAGSGAAPAHLRWSPSGRKLLYTLEPTTTITQPQVLVYDTDAQKLHNLGNGANPAWNADSDRVAFGRDGFGAQQIVVVTLASGQEERLGLGQSPTWLPDGKRLAVIRDGNIWLLAYPAGGADTQLTRFPTDQANGWTMTHLAYHYTGRILFYGGPNNTLGAQGNGLRLYSADLRTGDVKELTPPGGNVLVALDISPNGRYVALADQAHSSACASYGAVTVLDTADGTSLMLPLPATEARHAHVMGVSWAPQPAGRLAVAYNEFQCTGDQPGDLGPARVYLMDLPNIKALNEEAVGAWPAWNRGREGLGQAPRPGSLFGALLGGIGR